MGFLDNIFNIADKREMKKFNKVVDEIDALEPKFQEMSDRELKNMTNVFKDRLNNGETVDDILTEAFAVAREASKRVLGMRQYRVQLIGGIVLHQGRIAEMKTGEGKTLVATAPVYLNALTGKGVHVVTVNDYLAKRDKEQMGKIYEFLGMSVGVIVHGQNPQERKAQYDCDITYGTNNEYGFDYLKDNMVIHKEQKVQRELNYAIVDEVDSILVDEARTPLIISGPGDKSTHLYSDANTFIHTLKDDNFEIDEKQKSVSLTESGIQKAEIYFGVDNITDIAHIELFHHINQALKAHKIMKLDVDYVVRDGEIVIVDEFTGRLMFGRRYSEGLHQAIEAKEGLRIQRESKTLATITFQNYFRMYNKLSGMTGTAKTEEEEFKAIYKMDVVQIPTNKPILREDLSDSVYKSELGKFNAVVEDIIERHKNKQPVLVGTVSIEKSEVLSMLLKRKGVKHEVLNAKNHHKEAEIVAQAGRLGAVTIATNMAGRGTDIVLGGNPVFLTKKEMKKMGYSEDIINTVDADIESLEIELTDEIVKAKADYDKTLEKYKAQTEEEQNQVREAGGLSIIGTERHESRRIDNQLRGRAGRQGDPGSSRFYISLEDELMRLFGSDRISGMVEKIGLDEDTPIEAKMLTKSIENAQKKVEGRNFGIRKHVLQYDDVMNKQREIIYEQRGRVLEGENLQEQIQTMISSIIESAYDVYVTDQGFDLHAYKEYLYHTFMPKGSLEVEELESMKKEDLITAVYEIAKKIYELKEESVTSERMREIERVILLQAVDSHWIDHIDAMDQLRQGIGLRAIGQQDPVVAYKLEGFDMFDNMTKAIQEDTVRYLYNFTIEEPIQRKQVVDVDKISSNVEEGQGNKPVKKEEEIGRNDECPCGSGKKYKKCCGK
ncbi:protein translocase subunit SecA1 [[Clostridium] sordellii]|uniref:Protein translocase subunit SecA n=1 Tax=Paraclostridium sordellii TaxID=1505 RepID=A0ABM9RSZ6_PARSO|nr:preprotein translocase subunit SecA [Paeniclostridium sordellii]CEJ75192.1 Protein translocase subunit SecA1 [[Clostridium] sordellii] [Paeniclostridium sordellii]CEN70961.1 protein translocase subunit SecA1 [[Clostridium] sordellii] [Paeniclostridium sordellii]CEN74252.1 protein translocase subunit SecA1 [[Clostridium] sordellii] [Paeniclostridium sordellii]CEO28665.1 protein translocase subunit SecA1 [[Clostridium] sordellii] [Paeniclostridium sordellii]CEO30436.1 protein translocase subu